MIDPSDTIRTNRTGKRASADRDNRLAKADAKTEPIQIVQPVVPSAVAARYLKAAAQCSDLYSAALDAMRSGNGASFSRIMSDLAQLLDSKH